MGAKNLICYPVACNCFGGIVIQNTSFFMYMYNIKDHVVSYIYCDRSCC